MTMTLRVIVDRETCIACGVAPTLCSEVFVLEGKNRIVDKYSKELSDSLSVGEVPDELKECVENAAMSCPVEAIKIEEI